MRTTVVAAGAIVVAAVAAVPYVCGRVLEQEVRTAIDDYNKRQSFMAASIVSYDRQWLRSSFVTRLAIRDGAEVARATTEMRHAPFTGLRLASGDIDVHFAETLAATENYYFSGKVPLRIDFDIELGGATSGTLRTAGVDKPLIGSPNVRLLAAPSSGSFSIVRDKIFRIDWTLPKASYEDPKVAVAVEGVALSAFGQLGDDDMSEPSGLKIAVASAAASSGGGMGERRVAVKGFSLSTQMTPSAESLKFALALRAGAGEAALDASPYTWESLDLQCSVSDVPKAPVVKYSADVRNLSDIDANESQKMLLALRALSELAASVAQGDPAFAVDKLELKTPQGILSASLRVGIDKARATATPEAWTAADGFVMSGRASVSRPLAVRILRAAAPGEAEAQAAIARLAARGVVRESGDALEFDIAARDGVYLVNGVRATELARM
ncbi:MAG: DUF945 family protein [Burkholderiales bacterium]